MTLFKRGPRTAAVVEAQEKAGASDEEQGNVDKRTPEEKLRTDSGESISVPMMTDVFTWRNIQYDVNMKKGETRCLLDNISGFVAPGKLTALMGESGAGKVGTSGVYAELFVLMWFSLDYVAERSGGAASSWCCPWRKAREWISSAQRFPGTNVSSAVFVSMCCGIYVWSLQRLCATDGYAFGSDDGARSASVLCQTSAATFSTPQRKGGIVSSLC